MKANYKSKICITVGILLTLCIMICLVAPSISSLFAEEPENLPAYTKDVIDSYLDAYNGNVRTIAADHVWVSERKMIHTSDLIIRGKVKEVSSGKWDTADGKAPPEGSPRITYHELTIEVDRCYKGYIKDDIVTIKKLGGGVDDFALLDLDSFYYQPGDEVIMYLCKNSNAAGTNQSYSVFHPKGEIIVLDGPVYYNAYRRQVNWNLKEVRIIFNRVVHPLWWFEDAYDLVFKS